MSAALARILGVAPGDPVTVEVLEGRRPVRQARVTATVEDILGLNVTMDIRALNRLLGEGEPSRGPFSRRRGGPAGADRSAQAHPGRRGGLRAREHARELPADDRPDDDGDELGADPSCLHHRLRDRLQRRAHLALRARHELASLRVLGFTRREIRGDPARRARAADAGGGPARVRDRAASRVAAGHLAGLRPLPAPACLLPPDLRVLVPRDAGGGVLLGYHGRGPHRQAGSRRPCSRRGSRAASDGEAVGRSTGSAGGETGGMAR